MNNIKSIKLFFLSLTLVRNSNLIIIFISIQIFLKITIMSTQASIIRNSIFNKILFFKIRFRILPFFCRGKTFLQILNKIQNKSTRKLIKQYKTLTNFKNLFIRIN